MTIYASNALRPVVGNQYVPDSMEARGKIKPIPPVTGVRDGLGVLITVGLWSYEWGFSSMTKVEYNFWANLVGFGASTNYLEGFSKRFIDIGSGPTFMPAARLWVSNTDIKDFRTAVIDLPTWQEYKNGRYHDVLVKFSFLVA